MDNINSASRKWQNDHLLDDILVTIFMFLSVADVAASSLVCKTWNKASRDPSLWYKLDLSRLNSYYFNIPCNSLQVYKHSSAKMTQFLKHVLSLSNGNTTCLVFNFYVYLTDEQFIIAAERTPNLKRLVLPQAGELSRAGVNMALQKWRSLESITITSMVPHCYIFSAIPKNCKNITQMKFTFCTFEETDADAIIKYTPNLKVLSIPRIMVNINALCSVLTLMEHLEAVNICDSLIMRKSGCGSHVLLYNVDYLPKRLPPSSFRKLTFCQGGWCIKCKNGRDTTPSRQPYGPFEDIWRQDEITSLAH